MKHIFRFIIANSILVQLFDYLQQIWQGLIYNKSFNSVQPMKFSITSGVIHKASCGAAQCPQKYMFKYVPITFTETQ